MRRPLAAHARRRSAAVLCAAALCASAAAPPALAQGGRDPGGDRAQEEYKQHMTNGVKLFQDKNFPAAIAEFEAAYAARPSPNPLLNVALCYKGMFDYPRAIAALERALSRHGDAMSPEDRKAAEGAIQEMRALLALVTVEITPEGAALLVDGERHPAGTWESPVPLGPGAHRIGAEAEGYATAEERINVVSGEADKKVTLHLVPNSGLVTVVATDPGTAIAVDRKPAGAGEWKGRLSPGTHVVQFFKGGALVREAEILVAAGKEQRIREKDLPATTPGGRKGEKEEERPEPPMRGLYGLVTAGFFFPTDRPGEAASSDSLDEARDALSVRSGGAAGVRLGYRFNNAIGLELMLEYRGLEKTVTADEAKASGELQGDYSYQSARGGGNLRLMTPARLVRFVGALGVGISRDHVSTPSADPLNRSLTDKTTANFFVNSETGIELDFGGVLVGLTGQQVVGTEGASLAAGVRVGYGTW